MDLVTITDHDSVDGCLELLDRLGELDDFIIGEEVTATFPEFQHQVHIGVYGLTEAHHREIQKLRANGEELIAYLRQNEILFVLNHFFHDFAQWENAARYIERMAELFDVFEVRNGSMQRAHNTLISSVIDRYRVEGRRPGIVGGSDAHTLRRIGRTYTASPARTRQEFLEDIRNGRTQIIGPSANHLSLAADIYGVVLRYYPAVFSIHNGEFPPRIRFKNFFLSLLCAPFLFTPYVVAVRHSQVERRRAGLYSRLLLESRS